MVILSRVLCAAALALSSGVSAYTPEIETWINTFLELPESMSIRSYNQDLTASAHRAGTPEQIATGDYVVDLLNEYGWDAKLEEFTGLLNNPGENSVSITSPPEAVYECTLNEPALEQTFNQSFPSYVGYSANGDVTGELVYVNYGLIDDYLMLDEMGISLEGKVVIARYGRSFRGTKVWLAELRGAAAVLLYSDPQDDGYARGEVYPEGPWRPEWGIQRGSCQYLMLCPGNPLRVEECLRDPDLPMLGNLVPSIPVMPLAWGDAQFLLREIQGTAIPDESWRGALPFNYMIGPGPVEVRVNTNNDYQEPRMTNTIATMRGSEYPDEYILIGNHRDAWIFGAADPSSGTSVLLELGRVLGLMAADGWQPKRTIILATWDGEEYALMGSVNYAERHRDELMRNAVAYLNMDTAVTGPSFGASGTGSLSSHLRWAASHVTDPNSGLALYPNVWSGNVGVLGSGSDYTAFIHHLGVASTDFGFSGPYGVYHSAYDTFHFMDTFADPGFRYHRVAVQLLGVTMIGLVDAYVLPFRYDETAADLAQYVLDTESAAELAGFDLDMTDVRAAVDTYMEGAMHLTARIERVTDPDRDQPAAEAEIRSLNMLLRTAEQWFLDPEGLPGRFWYKHVLQAPGLVLGYGSEVFPGLAESIRERDADLARAQTGSISGILERAGGFLIEGPAPDRANSYWEFAAIGGGVVVVLVFAFLGYRSCCVAKAEPGFQSGQGATYDSLA